VAFTWVFIQEWVQQKGVLKGLSDGDVINIVSAGVFAVLIAAVTVRFLLEPASAGSASRLSSRRPINTSTARVGAGSGGSGGGRLGVAGSGTGSYIAGSDYNNVPSIAKTVRDVTNPYEDRNNVFVNFNDGRSPFGLKANAEIWNGRIAMVRNTSMQNLSASFCVEQNCASFQVVVVVVVFAFMAGRYSLVLLCLGCGSRILDGQRLSCCY
jgi:hypothetical protein